MHFVQLVQISIRTVLFGDDWNETLDLFCPQNKLLFPGLIQVIGLLLPNQTVLSTIIWQVE